MSKKRKKNTIGKHTRVKLDMSFDDALHLAANKPPMKIQIQELNKEVEVKYAAGYVVTFTSIEIPNNRITHYLFKVDVIGSSGEKQSTEVHLKSVNSISEFPSDHRNVTIYEGHSLFISIIKRNENCSFSGATVTYSLKIIT